MPSNLVKLGIGLAGATTVGVGATVIYLNTSKNEEQQSSTTTKKLITQFLNDENLELIGDGEVAKWDPKWKAFKQEYASVNPPEGWIMQNWDSKKGTESPTPEEFKQLCKDNGSKKVTDIKDNNFVLTKKHCTKTKGT